MKIYYRYLTSKLIINFVIVNIIIISIACLLQLLRFASLISKGVMMFEVVDVIIFGIPSIFYTISPFTSVLTTLYTYYAIIQNQEIIALRGLGLNNFRIALPALSLALIITCFVYYIGCNLLASSEILRNKISDLKNNYIFDIIKENSFNQINNNITIYLGTKQSNNYFDNIVIFDKTDDTKIFIAKNGKLNFDSATLYLKLYDGNIQQINKDKKNFNLKFSKFNLKVDLYDKKLVKNLKHYDIHSLLKSDDSKLRAKAHQMILWPSYNFALTFLSVALLLRKSLLFRDKVQLLTTLFSVTGIYFVLHILSINNYKLVYIPYIWTSSILLFSVFLI